MNEEEIAAKKRIEELEKEFAGLSTELLVEWDNWQSQKTKVQYLKRDRQRIKDEEEELSKREKLYSNRKIKLKTREEEIEREIIKLNEKFPNLKEAIKKEEEELERKDQEKIMKPLKIIAATITIIISASSVYDLTKWRRYEIFYDQHITEKIILKEKIEASGKGKDDFKLTKSFEKKSEKINSVWPILVTADRYGINLAAPSLLHLDIIGDSCHRAALVANISYLKESNGFIPKDNDGDTISGIYGISCWWSEGIPPGLLNRESNILKYIVDLPFIDLIPFFWFTVSSPIIWFVLFLMIILPLKIITNIYIQISKAYKDL